MTVHEGRIISTSVGAALELGPPPPGMQFPSGAIIADLDAPAGMAGSPVFLKNGELVGFIYAYWDKAGVSLIIPSAYIGDMLVGMQAAP